MTRGGLRPQTGCGNPGEADLRPIRLPEPPLVAETSGRAQDTPPAHRSHNVESAQSGKPACRAASTIRSAAVRSRIAEKTRSMARMVAAGSSRGKRATC